MQQKTVFCEELKSGELFSKYEQIIVPDSRCVHLDVMTDIMLSQLRRANITT